MEAAFGDPLFLISELSLVPPVHLVAQFFNFLKFLNE